MVYNIQNYWVYGLYLSSEITNNKKKNNISETWSVFVFRWGEGDTHLDPLERANLNHWTSAKGPNRGVSLPSPEHGNRSISETFCILVI
jgi:hypothetical protein